MRYHDLDLWLGHGSAPIGSIRARCAENHGTRSAAWSFDVALARAGIDRGEGIPVHSFPRDVHVQFERCLGTTLDEANAGVRLRLCIEDPELAAFPWEYLSADGHYLCASLRTPVVRTLDLPEAARPLTTELPLRMLVVIPDHPDLDAAAEKRILGDALAGVDGIEMAVLEGEVTKARLTAALESAACHVLHYIGHGDFDGESASLLLNDGVADTEWIASLLRNQERLCLVVLNSCRGASVSQTRPLVGLAPQLVRLGIPAVIAMQDEIADDDALHFARSFYTRLLSGEGRGRVDLAMCHARNELLKESDDPRAVGIPVLYLRSRTGVLFNVAARGLRELPFSGDARDTAVAVMEAQRDVVAAARQAQQPELADRETRELRALRTRIRLRDASIASAGVVALVAFFAFWLGLFDWLPKQLKPEHYTVALGDLIRESPLHEAIALVTIDTATVRALPGTYDARLNRFSPEWRHEHARLIDRLSEAGAAVIAFDIVFAQPNADTDSALVRAIELARARGTRVVLAARQWAGPDTPEIAPALLAAGADWGTACMGLPRHAPNVVPLLAGQPGSGRMAPSLSLAAVGALHDAPTVVLDTANISVSIISGGTLVRQVNGARLDRIRRAGECAILRSDDRVAEMILPYSPLGELRARRIGYEHVLNTAAPSLTGLQGRIVLVGAELGPEQFSVRRGLRAESRYGVQLHADAVSAVLRGVSIRWLSGAGQFTLILILALTGALVAGSSGTRRVRLGVLAAVAAAYLVVALYLYVAHGLLANALYHVLALLVAYRATVIMKRRFF